MENQVNETTNISFSKIASKFIQILKLKPESLCTPTFSPQIIDQLTNIFNQIQEFSEKNKEDEHLNQILFQRIALLIPNIEELINQNYLQFTIVSFQTKINDVYISLNEAINHLPQKNIQLGQIMTFLKQVVSRSYTCNFSKLSSSYFIDLRTSLNKLIEDLLSLQNIDENEANTTEQIPQAVIQNNAENLKQSSSILNHLMSSISFIKKTNSLIQSVRKVQQNSNENLPLQSHKIFVYPTKPKNQETENQICLSKTDQINESIGKLIDEFQSDPDKGSKIQDYSTKFNQYLLTEFQFPRPTFIFQNILRSFLEIMIQNDSKNEYFTQLSSFIQKVSHLLLFYYQLPENISRISDISSFIDQTNEFEKTLNEIDKNLNQFCLFSFRDFLFFCKSIKFAAETVDKVNFKLGQNLAFLDLRHLKLLNPGNILSYVDYQKVNDCFDDDEEKASKMNKFNYINTVRSLNVISEDIVTLRDRGIDIIPDRMIYEIHPISILPQIIGLRQSIRALEKELFKHFYFNFGEVNDNFLLSFFNIVQKEAEELYMTVIKSPLSAAELRIKTILLYQQHFPLSCEESVKTLLKFYSLTYDIYAALCKLDEVGTIPISSSIHLSYVLTICDDLADHYSCLNKYLEFFNSIDMFNIDTEKVLQNFNDLRNDLLIIVSQFSFNDIVKEILSYSNVISSNAAKFEATFSIDDNLTVNLLKKLASWVQGDDEYRSKSNIKELQIEMEVLKERLSEKAAKVEEFANSFDLNQILTVCGMFSKLRDRVEEKGRVNSLILFIEHSQDYSNCQNVPSEKIDEIAKNFEFSSENESTNEKPETTPEITQENIPNESNKTDENNENTEEKENNEITEDKENNESMQSNENIENIQSNESNENMQSNENIENMQSNENIENMQSNENIENIQNIENMQSNENIENNENVQNIETNENLQEGEIKEEKVQSPTKPQTSTPPPLSSLSATASTSSLPTSIISSNKKESNVFTNEKARQIWFEKCSGHILETSKQKRVIDYVIPSLVYTHFTEIITKYCHFLSLGDSFQQSVNEAFLQMVQEPINKFELTRDDLLEYFSSNYSQYKLFLKNSKVSITAQFDLTIGYLNELGAKLKNKDSHFGDIAKSLSAVRSSFKFRSCEWLKELIECYQMTISSLKENSSFTSLAFNVSSSFRKLYNMIYYSFLIRRCFKSLDSDRIPCELDTSLHLILMNNFSESDHLIPESSSINFQNQIQFILSSEIGSNSMQLETNMRILNLFGHIINLPLIISTLESEFFNFESFFQNIPHQMTNLQILINSALFSSANYVHNSLFELVSGPSFAIEKYENATLAFEKLKCELKSAPFPVELHSIDEITAACCSLADLHQIAAIDDSLCTFCSDGENGVETGNFILGADVFSLRVMLFALQLRLLKLTKVISDQYGEIFQLFIHNFSTTFLIPDNFGRYDVNDQFFSKFADSWSNFVGLMKPIDLSDIYDKLRQSCRLIISALNESAHKDLVTLKGIEQLFTKTHDPSLIFKLGLSFCYVRKQLGKYTKTYKESELPFDQIDYCLNVLSVHNEFCVLVQQITYLVNNTFNLTNQIHCLPTFSIDYKPIDGSENSIENQDDKLIQDQLSLADQNSLAQMIHIISAANQKDQERLTNLPILVNEVNELSDQVKETQKPIDQLIQIESYMSELLDIINNQTPNGKDEQDNANESSNKEKQATLSNYNRLKRDVSISTQRYQNMLNQYEDSVKMSLDIDDENEALLNEIKVKYEKFISLVTRAKTDRYNKLLPLLTNSYEALRKANDSMILISNDKYTKNEYDSPFNKNLININQNQNPINLELVYLKEKSYDLSRKRITSNQDSIAIQNFVNDLRNKNINDQIVVLEKLKNQLKNEVEALKKLKKT